MPTMTLQRVYERVIRAMTEELEVRPADDGGYWVYNPATCGTYRVQGETCTCLDYQYRCAAANVACKHVLPVAEWLANLDMTEVRRHLAESDDREVETLPDPEAVFAAAIPDPSWVTGDCPECGGPMVHNVYHQGGRGDVVYEECWHALTARQATPLSGSGQDRPSPGCSYRTVVDPMAHR